MMCEIMKCDALQESGDGGMRIKGMKMKVMYEYQLDLLISLIDLVMVLTVCVLETAF